MSSWRLRARVSRDTEMSEEMFDALVAFEARHLRTPEASFTESEVRGFLQETATAAIADAFKPFYLMFAPEATNLS